MRTVYDLMRADAALRVECRNCAHASNVSALLLRDRLGMYGRLETARWRCSRCDGRNVTISIGAASLAEAPKRNYRGIR